MRIMLDTNILISYILFNNTSINLFYSHVLENHKIVISNFILSELHEVFIRKFSEKVKYLDKFIDELDIEIIKVDNIENNNIFNIRDIKDYPILYGALKGNVDIFITGDKDFFDVKLDKPKIMTIKEYVTKYIIDI